LSENLHQDIENATREGWLRYLGFVAERDLPFLYAGARLFVYPSIYEGFGLPVLEAMASGVPAVTSNHAVLQEVAQGASLLAEPDDHDALLEGIRRGLTDEDWRSSAKIAGLRVAGGYSWDRCVEETIGVYRHVYSRL
jgi:alpha-1,3-rhamnosyl/mannosyltransferase